MKASGAPQPLSHFWGVDGSAVARGFLLCGLGIERGGCLDSHYVQDREATG